MASLFNLLNPDYGDVRGSRRDGEDNSDGYSSAGSISGSDPNEGSSSYYTRRRNRPNHEPHPDCPDTLDCLQDTDGRPPHTLPVILRCAILGSPNRRLTIREIYAAMESKYPYYKTAGPTWKQSVRHHLSLNRLFERQARPVTDPGFGSYWTVNLAAPPGTKRPRKRGRPKGRDGAPQPVRKRGRPRKDAAKVTKEASLEDAEEDAGEDVKETAEVDARQDARLVAEDAEEDREDVDGGVAEDDHSPIHEGFIHPFDRHTLAPYPHHSSPRPVASPAVSLDSLEPFGDPFEQLERLSREVKELRRQTSEANSLSRRMSDQLAHAQAEAWRAKAALQTAENKLKEECRRRQEAERLASEEVMRRRIVEESLEELRSRKGSQRASSS